MRKPVKEEIWIDNPTLENLQQKMMDAVDTFSKDKRFKFIDSGRHRYVYLHLGKGYVVKIAKNMDGLQANDEELSLFRKRKSPNNIIPKARCRRLSEVAIVMEYVHEMSSDNYPGWASSVDCRQVGINKKGELVAYDYSII